MNGYVWLGVIATVASILASGATILAHLRINRMQRNLLLSTSGSKSPITVLDSVKDPFIIQTGGGDLTLNYTIGGVVAAQPDISTPAEPSSTANEQLPCL
jgi:hypothetical protein